MNCYKCVYREDLMGDAHSKCTNPKARVSGSTTGIINGWFNHPNNYDPRWLVKCNGFKDKEK